MLNVVDFGAFVDIGLHDTGLVHVSQLANRYIRDPHEVAAVGDIVKVWVLEIDKTRRRVSLTMIPPARSAHGAARRSRTGRRAAWCRQGQRGAAAMERGTRPGRGRLRRQRPPTGHGQGGCNRPGGCRGGTPRRNRPISSAAAGVPSQAKGGSYDGSNGRTAEIPDPCRPPHHGSR